MALLVDRLRPRTLEALTYHHELSARLKALVCLLEINHSRTNHFSGLKPGLPSPPHLRPLGCRQENPYPRPPSLPLWPRCRKDQDRCPRLPDNVEPETGIQRRQLSLPHGNNALRCREL